ncbi:MFS transporter [Tellurirhabdus rosea]|uniref:MFS transporter n=1 Tax=Tellurirhabdus rosea TaxID=2674997 RepID=UPI00224D9953|nr:MFS transporter [Tellurirhabdus rosea]
MITDSKPQTTHPVDSRKTLFSVISASSVGTLIEWYDFYIFGSLATVLSTKFFPEGNPTAAFLSTLATFAAGFVVRPFGALFFGRLGDLIGRKYTFMVTLLLMGGATFAIGLVPSYETIGFLAPALVLILRLLQGLALGGEYGGAATYVAEHSPDKERGFWTSWIQTTATVGLFVSLLVIMLTRMSVSKEAFDDWGWRVPFWASIIMVGVSYIIRRNMHESPLFAKVKAEGKASTNPLKESFGNKLNFKFVLLALFGATMGQGVVWYTGQFYAMSFIEKVCNVDKMQSDGLMTIALLMGTPFFVVFGWLSDKIGRKGIMLAGMLIAVLTYRPIYEKMYQTTNLKNKTEITEKTTSRTQTAPDPKEAGGTITTLTVTREYTDGTQLLEVTKTKASGAPEVKKTLTLNDSDKWMLIFLVFIQVLYVTMVYGPIAAFLVEMFPTKIRYTSMSLPYHIGNGVFGGLLPAVATYLATKAKDANAVAEKAGAALPNAAPYLEGLWYPIIVASVCFVIGLLYINGRDMEIDD